jgi:hypothetical protein
MSVTVINKKMYHCICEWKECSHSWDAPATDDKGKAIDPPARCAKCKRYSWNRKDRTANGKANPEPQTRQKRAIQLPKPKRVRSYEE